jgi:hypothetical protein
MAGNRRKRTEGQANGKRLNVMMREESIRRLMIHVVMAGKNPGDVLSDLVDSSLKRWSLPSDLSARGKSVARDVELDRQSSDGEISLNVADMAA